MDGKVFQNLPRRFRNRIFLYLILLSSPPLVIWGTSVFWGSSQMITGFLENEILFKTEEVASKIETAKTLNSSLVRYIALELQEHERSDWPSVVSNMSIVEPHLYNVQVIDPSGQNVIRGNDDGTEVYTYDDRRYFREALAGKISHEMIMSRSYHRPALCSGQRIEPENVVVAVCRFAENLFGEIKRIQMGRTGYLFLVNEMNEVLIHPQLPFLSKDFSAVDLAAIEGANAPNFRFDFQVGHDNYRGFLKPISDHWKLIAVHDRSELYSWALEYLSWPTISGILSWFLIFILAYFAVDRSTLPLLKLTLATRNLGPHNLQEKVIVETQDEMGLLAESFNEMTERLRLAFVSLQEKENELQKSKDGLESLVIEQSQKLLYSTKMTSLGEMAGGIAHEVNNPLAIISMRAQKLREHVEGGQLDPKEIVETMEKIEKTCLRINQIIRGLRAFSRDGSLDPFVLENLSSIVWDTVSLCSEAIKNRGIDLQVQCDAEIEVECQPVQLGQVLLNLLTNAKDAVSDSKERWIRVEAKNVDEKFVEVSITDSGKGIKKADREKIMQPFFTTKQVGQGTGLGLSISRGIVNQHGGELYLQETTTHTQFTIRLPLHQKNKP